MAGQKIRIRLKAYDHEVIDSSAKKIVEQLSAQVQRSRVQCRYQQRRTHTVLSLLTNIRTAANT